jgi:shikimate O-hydroxycinnamoyltransferase
MSDTLRCKTVSKIRIQPHAAHRAPFLLNALDHFQAWFLVEVVYFYEHTLDPALLQRSLQQTLREFPQLCGQLKQGPDGTLCISYPHAGALLTVCECNRSMAEITAGLHKTWTVYDFIEKINPFLLLFRNRPLATFRITQMRGGGSALGISLSHALADAYSFYYFIRRWSQVHECQPVAPPLHDRRLLACTDKSANSVPRSAAVFSKTCRGFRQMTAGQLFRLISTFLAQQHSVVCRVLRFTRSQVTAIKTAAERLGPVSLNAALSAHLWQLSIRLNPAADTNTTRKLLIPANMRPKIDHPRAEHYFGNAISHVELSGHQSELANADISSVAHQCSRLVVALDQGHFREQMLWLERIEKHKQLFRVYADIDPYAGDCMISNLNRLPIYEAQFDGEKPFQAEVPVIPIPWVLQLFPAPGENNGIDVHAHIPRSAADKLKLTAWQAELYKYGEAADITEGS